MPSDRRLRNQSSRRDPHTFTSPRVSGHQAFYDSLSSSEEDLRHFDLPVSQSLSRSNQPLHSAYFTSPRFEPRQSQPVQNRPTRTLDHPDIQRRARELRARLNQERQTDPFSAQSFSVNNPPPAGRRLGRSEPLFPWEISQTGPGLQVSFGSQPSPQGNGVVWDHEALAGIQGPSSNWGFQGGALPDSWPQDSDEPENPYTGFWNPRY